MNICHHQIEIEAPPERAFKLCVDVEDWPQLFPPCQAACVLERTENKQLIELTALANGQSMTWRSERELHPEIPMVLFRQVRPSPLLKSMEGAWRFLRRDEGTLLTLEHRFTVKDEVAGLVAGITTREEAAAHMVRSTHENSQRELLALKQVLEQPLHRDPLRTRFQKELPIAAPPEAVYELLAKAEQWPSLLPHCEAIEMNYDDGHNQEFVMQVKVGTRQERIRSIRRCVPSRLITYFQPSPPPVLKVHTGAWRIEAAPDGAHVISQHEIVLRPAGVRELWGDIEIPEAMQRVVKAINDNSHATMQAMKARLERKR